MEVLRTWRKEIEAELAEAEASIETANAELQAASEAAAHARHERFALEAAAERLDPRAPTATALRSRLLGRIDELRKAEAPEVTARGGLKNARYRVQDLQLALVQLDQIDPPEPQPEPEPLDELLPATV